MSPDEVSVATLLDEVRPLVVEARARGGRPRFLLLPQDAYDAVERLKGADRSRGMPMIVLGLEIVRADERDTGPRVF